MPPEQVEGLVDQMDERADVNSLGATLYEVLTGHPPFTGNTVMEIFSKVLGKDPEPPGEECSAVDPRLPAICLKALRKERSERYPTAAAFAGALVTVAVLRAAPATVPLLPGLWAVFYGLGVFASRPYLPRAIGWVALFYLGAGAVLLGLAGEGRSLSPWAMGLVFGPGQLALALVLHWNLERKEND